MTLIRGAQKTNPFIIADQIAKAKVVQPQISNATIQSTPPSGPPRVSAVPEPETNRITEAIRSNMRGEELAKPAASRVIESGAKEDAASQSGMSELYSMLHKHLDPTHRSQNQHQEPYDLGQQSEVIATAADKWSPGLSTAESTTDKTLSPTLRRVRLLKHVPSSGNLESVIEVDVAAGDNQTVPRVRVSSPPSWLRQPTQKLGGIEGRLRHVGSKESPLVPPQVSINEVSQHPTSPHLPDVPAPAVKPQSGQVRRMESQQHLRPGNQSSSGQYQQTAAKPTDPGLQDSRRKTTGSMLPGQRTRRPGGSTAEMRLSETEMSLKSVSDNMTERNGTETPNYSQLEDEDDIGIQGLTIVLQYVWFLHQVMRATN